MPTAKRASEDIIAATVDPSPLPLARKVLQGQPRGYVDFYGYHSTSGGWVFFGWVSPRLREEITSLSMKAIFEAGELAGEAVVSFFDRSDLDNTATGLVFFLSSPDDRLMGRLTWIELKSDDYFSLIVSPGCPQVRSTDIASRLIPILGKSPINAGRANFMSLLSRRGYTGEDTLGNLKDNIQIGIDAIILCPHRGLVIMGWMVTAPGALRSICLKAGLNAVPIEPRDFVRIDRPDVLDAIGGWADWQSGFIAFVPIPLFGHDQVYIEVETSRAEIGFKSLPAARLEGMPALRHLLDGVQVRFSDIVPAFDKVIGPAVSALNQERLKRRPGVAVLDFGQTCAAPIYSVIIPLYGRMDYLEYQIGLLSVAMTKSCELIYVLDDPPKRREVESLAESVYERFKLPFRLLILDRNMGFAPANNIGLSQAKGEFICFLNSDVFPSTPDWLSLLGARLSADPKLGVVGPLLLFEDGSVQHEGMSLEPIPQFANWMFPVHPRKGLRPEMDVRGLVYCTAITGACMMIRHDVALDLGGFDEAFIIGDFEDSDLCFKIKAAGLECGLDRDVRLFHLERKSQVGPEKNWRMNLTLYNAWVHQNRWFPASNVNAAAL